MIRTAPGPEAGLTWPEAVVTSAEAVLTRLPGESESVGSVWGAFEGEDLPGAH